MTSSRLARLQEKTTHLMRSECDDQKSVIRDRADYTRKLDPFIESLALTLSPSQFIKGSHKDVVMVMCVQAPLELFHAANLQPFKLACGSHIAGNMAPLHLPALTCPMIKSISGLLQQDSGKGHTLPGIVIPTTCDWVVKFSELTGLHTVTDVHFLELPHLRENERSSRRWLQEIQLLKTWLEKKSDGQSVLKPC